MKIIFLISMLLTAAFVEAEENITFSKDKWEVLEYSGIPKIK